MDGAGLCGRQRGRDVHPSGDPAGQIGVGGDPLRIYIDEAPHGSSREIHHVHVGLAQGLLVLFPADSNHETIIENPAAHVTEREKGEATEHLLLFDGFPGGQDLANTSRELL